jgi:diguanylate cyclase (GGDEF)-like protein
MKSRTLRIAAISALGATLVAIYLYPHIPQKRVALISKGAVTFLYADVSQDGQNGIDWLDADQHRFVCFRRSDASMQFCGYNALLSDKQDIGMDLSGYDSIVVNFRYEGPAEILRLFFRHFDPRYSTTDDPNSAKFISATIRTQELQKPLIIDLDEFRVADWWLQQHNLPRQLARPEFHNVTALGIDIAENIAPGEHLFDVQSVDAVGHWVSETNWYLSMLTFWMVAIFGLIVQQWYSLHRQAHHARSRLRQLASENSSLHTAREQYRQLSNTDALTGIYNRRGIELAAQQLVQEQPGDELTLILVDIDHFKQINDDYGHDAGDRVLVQIAQLISLNTRKSDFVGRWGGEEFIVLCSRTDLESGFLLAEKVRQAIASALFQTNSRPLRVTGSFGVATANADEAFSEVFRRADYALYEAKHGGRNCSVRAV